MDNTEVTLVAKVTAPPKMQRAGTDFGCFTSSSSHDAGRVVGVDPSLRRFLDNRLLVTGLLLLVGPLGLPALWLNRRFSVTTKVLGTVGFMFLTVALPIVLTWYWCHHALLPLVDAFGNAK